MEERTPRERMLKNIRRGLLEHVEAPKKTASTKTPAIAPITEDSDVLFAQNLVALKGNFQYCEDEREVSLALASIFKSLPDRKISCKEKTLLPFLDIHGVEVHLDDKYLHEEGITVTSCEALVARTGTVVVTSRNASGRRMSVIPTAHIVIARTSQLFNEIGEALGYLEQKYEDRLPSMVSFISGPSRTADIEKTLVLGAHGPRDLYVLLLEDRV